MNHRRVNRAVGIAPQSMGVNTLPQVSHINEEKDAIEEGKEYDDSNEEFKNPTIVFGTLGSKWKDATVQKKGENFAS